MPDHLDLVTAQISGFFVESVLYGLYLYTFFRCLYILTRSKSGWKRSSDIEWGLIIVTLVLFANGTVNISLGLLRLIQQFALHVGAVAWIDAAKLATVNLETMIAEGVMIYRCFHVWGRSWTVISLPLILWLADLGIALWKSWLEGTTHTPLTSGLFPTTASVFWGLIVAINIYTTGMIVYRIWNVLDCARDLVGSGRVERSTKKTRLNSVIRIVIDSGLGYTLVTLTLFFSQLARSNALYITSAAEVQAVGMAFNLINIRVAYLKNEEQDATRVTHNTITTSPGAYDSWNVATGPTIKFNTISEPSFEVTSTFVSLQGRSEKSIASGSDSSSSV